MTDRWQSRISEYIDGELTPSESRRFEQHLTDCDECLVALRELKLVVAQTSQLPLPAVPPRVWEGLARRLEGQGFGSGDGVGEGRRPVRTVANAGSRIFSIPTPLLAAACLTLMVFSAGAGWWMRGSQNTDMSASAPVRSVDEDLGINFDDDLIPRALINTAQRSELPPEMQSALSAYEASVAQLEATLVAISEQLDPMTMEVIEGNLEIIDNAIYEARVALIEDPNSGYLSAHLADSMKRKLRLLRRATRLASNEI